MQKLFILYSILLFTLIYSLGQNNCIAQKNNNPNGIKQNDVMDFDADVIEGELKRPDLFLQLGTDKVNMESMIYGRNNFNDFNKIDRMWRIRYFELKRAAKVKP